MVLQDFQRLMVALSLQVSPGRVAGRGGRPQQCPSAPARPRALCRTAPMPSRHSQRPHRIPAPAGCCREWAGTQALCKGSPGRKRGQGKPCHLQGKSLKPLLSIRGLCCRGARLLRQGRRGALAKASQPFHPAWTNA